MDGKTYSDIFTVSEEIHEGWNYHNYSQGMEPKFRYYRFQGSAMYSCIVGEIGLIGYEVIDSMSDSYTCNVTLVLNGAETPL
jgi:hypothetical protein